MLLETLTVVLLAICTTWAYVKLSENNSGPAPLFVKYTVAFWYVIQPTSLTLGLLFCTEESSELTILTIPEAFIDLQLYSVILSGLCLAHIHCEKESEKDHGRKTSSYGEAAESAANA